VTACKQFPDNRGADKSGSAGYKNAHAKILSEARRWSIAGDDHRQGGDSAAGSALYPLAPFGDWTTVGAPRILVK
jgi:hypothetical protein